MQWLKNLFTRPNPDIPADLWHTCTARQPFLQALTANDLARLKALAETLLATKTFTGAGGFELTDEVAVLIASQAALPILNLTIDLYDDMAGVIVYPAEFVVPQSEIDEAGVVHEWHEAVAGEAMGAGGAVVLSWEDVANGEEMGDGYNVVIHEFAHKIDMANGDANGCPPFLPCHGEIDADTWRSVFSAAFADFNLRVDRIEQLEHEDPRQADALLEGLPLDPYAASNPGEFFAVASEAFFVQPAPLEAQYPALFRLLMIFYQQNPLLSP